MTHRRLALPTLLAALAALSIAVGLTGCGSTGGTACGFNCGAQPTTPTAAPATGGSSIDQAVSKFAATPVTGCEDAHTPGYDPNPAGTWVVGCAYVDTHSVEFLGRRSQRPHL